MNFEQMPVTQGAKKNHSEDYKELDDVNEYATLIYKKREADEDPEATLVEGVAAEIVENSEATPADKPEIDKATEAGESVAKVLEDGMTQEAFNQLIESLHGSVVMKPFEAAWNALPGRLQKAIVNPNLFERIVKANPVLMVPSLWFEKMAKSGLLEMKNVEGVEGEDVLAEGQENDEEARKFASEIGNTVSGGEASGFMEMVTKVASAQEDLMKGSREHLARIKEAERMRENVQNLQKTEETEKETSLEAIRESIAAVGGKEKK